MSYALRPRIPGERAKASLLNFEELSALAHALHTDRYQTRILIFLGLSEWAPPELRVCISHLYNDNKYLAVDLGREAPPLKFSGPLPDLIN